MSGYLETIVNNETEGSMSASVLEPWMFIISGNWDGMTEHTGTESIHDECLALWESLGYTIDQERWEFYKNSALAIKGSESMGINATVDGWESYFEFYHICFIEIIE